MKLLPHTLFIRSALMSSLLVMPALMLAPFSAHAEYGSSSDRGYGGGSSSSKSSSSSSSSSKGAGARSDSMNSGADRARSATSSSTSGKSSNGGYGNSAGSRSDNMNSGADRARSATSSGSGSKGRGMASDENANRPSMSVSEAKSRAQNDINGVKGLRAASAMSGESRSTMNDINAMGAAAAKATSANYNNALTGATPALSGQNLKTMSTNLSVPATTTGADTLGAAKTQLEHAIANAAAANNNMKNTMDAIGMGRTPTTAQMNAIDAANAEVERTHAVMNAAQQQVDKLSGKTTSTASTPAKTATPAATTPAASAETAYTASLPSLEDFLNGNVKVSAPAEPVGTPSGLHCTTSNTMVNGVKKVVQYCR